MKRYCKNVNIESRELISSAAYQCLSGKMKRPDTLRMLSTITGLPANQLYCIQYRYGEVPLYGGIEQLVDAIQKEIISRKLEFPEIWYKNKIDTSSGKTRKIGIQNIKQQVYDYVAVIALKPVFKRVGRHQYASIEGRGTEKGVRQIRRWLRNKNIRYLAKADIKKCFLSISHNNMMEFLEKYIANEPLLWLVSTLLSTFDEGLSIGSYLSQHLCNLYMSQIYHYIAETCTG